MFVQILYIQYCIMIMYSRFQPLHISIYPFATVLLQQSHPCGRQTLPLTLTITINHAILVCAVSVTLATPVSWTPPFRYAYLLSIWVMYVPYWELMTKYFHTCDVMSCFIILHYSVIQTSEVMGVDKLLKGQFAVVVYILVKLCEFIV